MFSIFGLWITTWLFIWCGRHNTQLLTSLKKDGEKRPTSFVSGGIVFTPGFDYAQPPRVIKDKEAGEHTCLFIF